MQNQTRNKRGQYSSNEVVDSKFIVVCLMTSFIMIATAYMAHAQTVNTPSIEEKAVSEMYCLDKYCTQDKEQFIKQLREQSDTVLPVASKAKTAPKTLSKKYTRKSANAELESLIRQEAAKQGYKDIELALDLVDCESRFNVNAKNTNKDSSTDNGLWQINSYWHKELPMKCRLDAQCSTAYSINLLKRGEAHLWSCYRIVR